MDSAMPRRFGWRWLIIIARVVAVWTVFLLVAPFHFILSLIGLKSLIPPRFLRLIGWLIGLHVRIEGRPATGRLLLLANHVTWLDIIGLAGASGTSFVAQGGLAKFPFLKWLCEQNGTVFIAREERVSVSRQVEEVRAALMQRRMAIFPEGTTSYGREMLPFKSALLSAAEGMESMGVRVQPVALEYRSAPAIAWHDGENGKDNALRILARINPVHLTVRFLPPLSGAEVRDRKAMAFAAQMAITRSLML